MRAMPLPDLPPQKHESVKSCSRHSGLCFPCTDAFHLSYFCFPRKHCRTQCLFSTTAQVLISLALPQGWNWSPVSYGITWEGTGGPRLGWKGVLGYGEDEGRLWTAPTIQDFQPKPFILFAISMEICSVVTMETMMPSLITIFTESLIRPCGLSLQLRGWAPVEPGKPRSLMSDSYAGTCVLFSN